MEKAMDLLTVPEVARILRVSCGWVREHARGRVRPVLPSVRIGRFIRFESEAVSQFIGECRCLHNQILRRRKLAA